MRPRFVFSNALSLARLSDAVYQLKGSVDVSNIFPDAQNTKTFDIPRYLVRFVYLELEDRHIVCFRGSIRRRASWQLNMNVKLAKVPFGSGSRLHVGYLRQAAQAYNLLKGRLGKGKPVVMTGHSQGGALALCLATHLARFQRRSDLVVLSFGQPKVGDRGYCRFLDLHRPWETERFVNLNDGVALCPSPAFGHEHCEVPTYLLGDGVAEESARFRFGAVRTLRNHPVALYVQNLETLAR